MKVYNPKSSSSMHKALEKELKLFRSSRNFNSEAYIEAKAIVLNQYLKTFGLKSCVVAVSGGIDSAVTLGLVLRAKSLPLSPLEQIVPVLLPARSSNGVTNQDEATNKGRRLCQEFGLSPFEIDLSQTYEALKSKVDRELGTSGEPWANGQLVPYLRTPTLYYITSLLAQENKPGVICGTTNFDEGAYLGYFGKASDGLVDIQMISDIHKSEVFEVGRTLGVTKEILEAVPTGDMFDSRVDEEVFGASYDFVELYLNYLKLDLNARKLWINKLPEKALFEFNDLASHLEKLHKYNKHKYLGSSPAVHLDLFPTKIEGGWRTNTTLQENELNFSPDQSKFIGFRNFSATALTVQRPSPSPLPHDNINLIRGALGFQDIKNLLEDLRDSAWTPVAQNGFKSDYQPGGEVGSYRMSTYREDWAKAIWESLRGSLAALKIAPDDKGELSVWHPIGVSSLFRFILYKKDGLLIPHYDSPFVFSENCQTLKSVILYLTDNEGGATRFIKENRFGHSYSDWTKPPTQKDVLFSIKPQAGSALIFDHRLLHDSEALDPNSDEKIIVRTDLIFRKFKYD